MFDSSLWNIPEGVGLRYTGSYHVCGSYCALQCSIQQVHNAMEKTLLDIMFSKEHDWYMWQYYS